MTAVTSQLAKIVNVPASCQVTELRLAYVFDWANASLPA